MDIFYGYNVWIYSLDECMDIIYGCNSIATTMADPQPVAPLENGPAWGSFARSTLRSLVFFWLFRQLASGLFGNKGSVPSPGVISSTVHDSTGSPLKAFSPVWSLGTTSDLYVFVSPNERAADVSFTDPTTLLWSEKALVFGSDSRAKELVLPCTPVHPILCLVLYFLVSSRLSKHLALQHLQRNGSLYAHIFLTKAGLPPNPMDPSFDKDTLYHRKLLTRFMPKKKETSKKKLVVASSPSPKNGEALNGTEPLEDTTTSKKMTTQ